MNRHLWASGARNPRRSIDLGRFIYIFFGAIFSLLTLGVFLGAGIFGGILLIYGENLPDHNRLANYSPPTISRVYSVDGTLMDEFARERRLFTPSDEIPKKIKYAFISAEDKNFYVHTGFDIRGIASALIDYARGERLRGASTITQQVMKNFLLDGSRSLERKIKEIILAARLEQVLGKEQILELYLNEIFLGQNSYGVTAAAETYFAKPLESLTISEAAYLAALPKKPSEYHPVRNVEAAVARRNFVLKEMRENGYITKEEEEIARATELRTVQSGYYASRRSERPPRDYFTDEIRRQLSSAFGEEEFFTGGLKIRATMDPELQAVAATALRKGLEAYDREAGLWRGALDTLPDTALIDEGAWRAALSERQIARDIDGWSLAVVLALGEGEALIGIEGRKPDSTHRLLLSRERAWAKLSYDKETDKRAPIRRMSDMLSLGDIVYVSNLDDAGNETEAWSLRQPPALQGGFMAMDVETGRVLAMQGGHSYQGSVFNRVTQAQRQPGSSIKPFVYASALDSGYSPVSIVVDAPIEINTPQGVWRPRNAANKFYGPAPLRVGIEQSRNLMTVRLAQDVGMDIVADYTEKFGVYDKMQQVLSAALGAQETTLFNMVAAYAMFANGGERVIPTLVDRVQDRYGRTVYRHDKRRCVDCDDGKLSEGFGPRVVKNRIRVMDEVTAFQLTSMMRGVVDRGTARSTVKVDAPVAGKTGTTNDAKDVWFVGFTPRIVAGCYMGFDTPRTLGRGASGGGFCGPVFTSFMNEAVKKYGKGQFRAPKGGVHLKFDRFTGARLNDDAEGPDVVAEFFKIGEEPIIGLIGSVIDGGFAMGEDLDLFVERGETDGDYVIIDVNEDPSVPNASTGRILSGGTY